MTRYLSALMLSSLLLGATGCAGSAGGPSGSEEDDQPRNPGEEPAVETPDGSEPGPPAGPDGDSCDLAACDDGNACTTDSCGADGGCHHARVGSAACRPQLTVEHPRRAATLTGGRDTPVLVEGKVTSGAGAISSVTINGESVAVSGGRFSHEYRARYGANTLDIVAMDALGSTTQRIQSFHYSSSYAAQSPGLGIWIGQETLDAAERPDLARIMEGVLADYDLGAVFDPSEPVASEVGFDIFLTSLARAGTHVSLQAIEGGLRIQAELRGIAGELAFDCTCAFPCGCKLAGGDSGGGLYVSAIVVQADLLVGVTDGRVAVSLVNAQTDIESLEIWSNARWTDRLLTIVERFVLDGLIADLEADVTDAIGLEVAPVLEGALGALAFDAQFEVPRLDAGSDNLGAGAHVPVQLHTDLRDAGFTALPQGGFLAMSASAESARGVPVGAPFDDNQGVPQRLGCGTGEQTLVIPGVAPIEVAFSDDALNAILRSLWWGGLLELEVGPELLGDVDLSAAGVEDLELRVSAELPPLLSDCNAGGVPRLHVGDLRIDASLIFAGQRLDLVVYAFFDAPVRLEGRGAQIALTIEAIENVQLDVTVVQEALAGSRDLIAGLLERQLVPALGALLGSGEPLVSFPLPEADLSAAVGQEPGTSVLRIETLRNPPALERQAGNTVLYGRLATTECFGETEVCDGIDNDCDGLVDEDVDPLTEAVVDRCPTRGVCGQGRARQVCSDGAWVCALPDDYQADECPVATPSCGHGDLGDDTCSDGIDNDCDGVIDEHDPIDVCAEDPDFARVSNGDNCYVSQFGRCGSGGGTYQCVQLAEGCGVGVDCIGATFPETERCDNQDWDCDGFAWDRNDRDGDGYGDCSQVRDCNETRADIYPGARELCDGVDNDCDGAVDEVCSRQVTATVVRLQGSEGLGGLEFYSILTLAWPAHTETARSSVIGGTDIRPGWAVTGIVGSGVQTVDATLRIRDEDGGFRGSDDEVDVHPGRDDTAATVRVEVATGQVRLIERGVVGRVIGRTGQLIVLQGTDGTEEGILTFRIDVRLAN